jgi:carboxylate-amine ligase
MYWKAARYGLADSAQSLSALIDRVTPALKAVGDAAMVRAELDRVVTEGNGAVRQRRAWQRRNDVADVIEEAATATLSGV